MRDLRSALRTALAGKTFVRHLPREFGSAAVYVSPDSQLKHLLPGSAGFDASLLKLVRDYVKPGDHVWDIGANLGVFTHAARGVGASVVAVEPDPYLVNCLLRSRARNSGLAVEIVSAAVSEQKGIAHLEFSSGGRAANALSQYAGARQSFGESRGRLSVPTLRLDDLLVFGNPAFVKIDVEGAELAALKGANRLLNEVRPTLYIEVDSAVSEPISALLKAAGFDLYEAAEMAKVVDVAPYETIAVPRS